MDNFNFEKSLAFCPHKFEKINLQKELKRKSVIFVFLSLLSFYFSFCAVINVPIDYSTIQAGIDISADSDTVLVQPGTYFENINFNSHNITLGSLFLTTSDTSYISQTVIDGNQNGSVVIFESGEDTTAVLSGFTIRNGFSTYGGGIFCVLYSSPKISYNIITGNIADNGGGISINYFCNPIIENVKILSNIAEFYGGGITNWNQNNTIIRNAVISNNTAQRGGGISGSGIEIVDSEISHNTAVLQGGGMKLSGLVSLNNVQIFKNTSIGDGGGIYASSAEISIYNSMIIENISYKNGGGVYTKDISNINISNSNILGNQAVYGIGGGIYCDSSNVIFDPLNKCNIYLNYGISGNDFYSNVLINVVIDTFTVINPNDYHTLPAINFINFISNAIFNQTDQDMYVAPNGDDQNSGLSWSSPLNTIKTALLKTSADSLNPVSIFLAQGIYSVESTNEIFPISMFDNSSLIGTGPNETELNGGGERQVMHCLDIENVMINKMTITNGSIVDQPGNSFADGGGVSCIRSSIIFEDVDIISNNCDYYGGGMYIDDSEIILIDNTIESNTATMGGGMYIVDSNINLNYVDILENSSSYSTGGGMFINGSVLEYQHGFVSTNISNYGDVIDVGLSSITLKDVSITNNTTQSSGGALSLFDVEALLINVTVAHNSSLGWGGGILSSYSSNLTMINSIVWGNTPSNITYSPYLFPNQTHVYYSDVDTSNYSIVMNDNGVINWNSGNIFVDPQFFNASDDDFRLTEYSPCIDSGTDLIISEGDTLLNMPQSDYWGDAPDMGAFEFNTFNGIAGDMDQDGSVNILDIIIMVDIILGHYPPGYNQLIAGDANFDNEIDILDIIIIVDIILSSN
ncbi:MAG: hypothetical protein HQ510_09375 [Candidatus Marinimicrobia bacterium]|nr:hypothetical protein [Candidatus Neomarinimicrobiota bacterium]